MPLKQIAYAFWFNNVKCIIKRYATWKLPHYIFTVPYYIEISTLNKKCTYSEFKSWSKWLKDSQSFVSKWLNVTEIKFQDIGMMSYICIRVRGKSPGEPWKLASEKIQEPIEIWNQIVYWNVSVLLCNVWFSR